MIVLAGGPSAAAEGAATEAVRSTINEVIRILKDAELKKPGRAEDRRRLLEKVIGDRFSYEEMARRSLGAQWNKLSDGEKQEFVNLFKRLLSSSYADKIEGYSGEQVQYLNERQEDEYAEVRTKVASDKTEIPLDYRLLNKSGDWRVYDVVVDTEEGRAAYVVFSVGLKVNPFQTVLLAANVKIPINDEGLRADYIWAVGVEVTLP